MCDGGGVDHSEHEPTKPAKVTRLSASLRLSLATLAIAGCAAFGHGFRGQPSYPLYVTNRTDFEVVVYSIPSPGVEGVRLGNVPSFGSAKLSIPRGSLQANDYLVLQVRGIGAARRATPYTLNAVQLDSERVAILEVRGDAAGSLRYSSVVVDYP